ncbi:MAG: hypothetical protein NZ772_10480 [Cyanobacteria bacterium]|nr:hypothetical protein [Cyanobacteriota bacterium]MDW8201897.1 hypothetical protein [Cyanobacteriota bacterium SKYGB_h_bin112]
MDVDQREVRRAAAKAFLDSLDQLQASLQANDYQSSLAKSQAAVNQPISTVGMDSNRSPADSRNTAAQQNASKSAVPVRFTLQDLEMAIADIDNYIESKARLGQFSNLDQETD